MSDGLAVRAEGLRKRYGDKLVLGGLDLSVPAGTVHGLLGPNGAGKTTAVRILSILLRFDAGRAEVAGSDVAGQAEQVRYRIGLVGQHAAVDEILSGRPAGARRCGLAPPGRGIRWAATPVAEAGRSGPSRRRTSGATGRRPGAWGRTRRTRTSNARKRTP